MKKNYPTNRQNITDASFYILASVINEQHGYMIMKTIKKNSANEETIGPASLYTTLKKLLYSELIELNYSEYRKRKVYKITNKGIEVLLNEIKYKKQMISFAEKFLQTNYEEEGYEK